MQVADSREYTVHGILQTRILEWAVFPFSKGIFPAQGSKPGLLHCREILYQLSHRGSSRIRTDSLSLLQGIILTQELNWGLLHHRCIRYQLSYEGSQSLLSHYLFENLGSEEMRSSYSCYTNHPPSFTHISPIGW